MFYNVAAGVDLFKSRESALLVVWLLPGSCPRMAGSAVGMQAAVAVATPWFFAMFTVYSPNVEKV